MEAAMGRWNELSLDAIITVAFVWEIFNFSACKGKKYSNILCTNDTDKWRVLVYPKGNYVDHLSAYLVVDGAVNLTPGWSRLARFRITVVNQLDRSRSITKETVHIFDKKDSDWGFTSLIPLTVLKDQTNGYLVDDTCVIEAHVAVPKAFTTLANETGSSAPVQPLVAELQMKVEPTLTDFLDVTEESLSSTPSGESINFRGFGKVDKAFIPLLEDVCAKHPSLVECVQDKGEDFTQWAFSTLGRVLYFLDTRKRKDITAECCQQLKLVWTTLGYFKFDLSWLKDDYEAALLVEAEVERAKTMREEMNTLDTQRKRLRVQLAQVEASFEEAQQKVADVERLLEGGLQFGRGSALSRPPTM